MIEFLTVIYTLIGLVIAFNRMDKATKNDQTALLCIGAIVITILWPIYRVYKVCKHKKKPHLKSNTNLG